MEEWGSISRAWRPYCCREPGQAGDYMRKESSPIADPNCPEQKCYLCGKALGRPSSKDHVPPKQFYSTRIRSENELNLLTLQAHPACNLSYQHDEDYFAYSIGQLVPKTFSGHSLLLDVGDRLQAGKQKLLFEKVRQEWDRRPAGLILPPGKTAKRIEGERIGRIAWKITRGLFFNETKTYLPEDTPRHVKMLLPDEVPPPWLGVLATEPDRGKYPGIFNYRYCQIPEADDAWVWANLFWDAVLICYLFDDPACSCEQCGRGSTAS